MPKKGYKQTEVHKMKLSETHKNKKNGIWKGDKVGYFALHTWIDRNKQKIGMCIICNEYKRTQWANLHHIKNGGKYYRNLDDYFEVCCSCHRVYDYHKI